MRVGMEGAIVAVFGESSEKLQRQLKCCLLYFFLFHGWHQPVSHKGSESGPISIIMKMLCSYSGSWHLGKDQDHKPETDTQKRTRIINRKQILHKNHDHKPEADTQKRTRIINRKQITQNQDHTPEANFSGIDQHFSILHRNGTLTV
jgi:hypothetical protein